MSKQKPAGYIVHIDEIYLKKQNNVKVYTVLLIGLCVWVNIASVSAGVEGCFKVSGI